MNYYEELGLPRTATQEQIRRAYRSACLLLHPDRHSDREQARMAELQMQRMNDLYRTLSEPDKRWRYDQEISAGIAKYAAGPKIDWANWIRKAGWYAGATLSVVAISWYISGERIKTAAVTPQSAEDAAITGGGARLAGRRTPTVVTKSRSSLKNLRPQPAGEPQQRPMPAVSMPVETARSQSPSPVPGTQSNPPSEAAPRLAGTWFYAHPPGTVKVPVGFYAPQFIQVTIRETGTRIQGRYAARYLIPNRAISPDVSFRFEGTLCEDHAMMTWSGSGGSRGDARIVLLAENRLELSWSAAELGQQLGLAEGRAILVRASPR